MTPNGARADSARNPLSLSDLDTSTDEPRVKDVRIGERLGMAQPLDIRRTIDKNAEELRRYGPIRTVREKVQIGSGAIREITAYHLNEAQTLLLCMLSRTDRAADVRQEVIEVFMAWRRGETPPERLGGCGGNPSSLPDLSACPPGTGAMVTENGIVWFDATRTDLTDGEPALVVRNWRTRPQVPFVAPLRVLQGYDIPAEDGCAHLPPEAVAFLPKGLRSPIPCRIFGRVLRTQPKPHPHPSLPDIARHHSRIADLENREAQLLAIIDRLSGSLAAPAAPAPASPRVPQRQPQSRRAPKPQRLSEETVSLVGRLLDQGLNNSQIAALVGISRPSVRRIRNGTWPHRKGHPNA